MKTNYKISMRKITTFIFDVDGVLTNGGVFMFPGQEPVRMFNSKDGFALQLAIRKGFRIGVITGGRSEGVIERLKALGIIDIYTRAHNKIEAYRDFVAIHDLQDEEILYMGDDLPDYEVMQRVGVACAPNDAAPEILSIAHYVSPQAGGQGCARDVIEQTLKVQQKWLPQSDWTW
jgi:3-deoxy-D-manno-octulosonate 8-phosphate phosphatase (KDO 8-P phosphatase)